METLPGLGRRFYRSFPAQLWLLCGVSFFASLGNAVVFPFFTLYLTEVLGVSMTLVGTLLSINAILSLLSQSVGGELTDRWGRKRTLLFGFSSAGVVFLWMATARSLAAVIPALILGGLVGNLSGPASSSMVADLVAPDRRTSAYSLLRIAYNLAFAIGPALGGLVAARSYGLLFAVAGVLAIATAATTALLIHETAPHPHAAEHPDPAGPAGSYADVLRDRLFLAFWVLTLFGGLGYSQLMTTLPVYLKRWHGLPETFYGFIMSLNAALIVLLQFPVARVVEPFNKALSLGAGTLLYAAGFTLMGVGGAPFLFVLGVVVITLGELVLAPVSTAFTADLAPEHLRGRYMGAFGLTWGVSFALGAFLGGAAMDRVHPMYIWFACGASSLLAGLGFLALARRVEKALRERNA